MLYMKFATWLVSGLKVCKIPSRMHLGICVQVAAKRGVTRSASGSACFRWEEYLSIVTTTQPETLTSVPSTSNAGLLVWPAVGCAPSGPTADPPRIGDLAEAKAIRVVSARSNR